MKGAYGIIVLLCGLCLLLAGCSTGRGLQGPVDWRAAGIVRIPEASDYPDEPAVVLLDEGKMEVVGSGELVTSVFERRTVVKVLTTSGQRFANLVIPYGSGSTVDQIQARTVAPDGKVFPLGDADIFDVSLYPNFVFYSDQRAKIFTLPAVQPGAILEYRYRIQIGGRAFWHTWEFQSMVPTLLSRFTLVRPSEWEVNSRLYGIAIEPRQVRVPEGFKATTTWETADVPALRPEPGMPPVQEVVARLAIAPLGIKTWNDVAAWYRGLAEERMKDGPSIRALAESLTAGVSGDREKLRVLYDWVRDHVRYMAVEIGIGGFQPHAAEDVCGRLYGDCKDMTTLLCALGSAAGLEVRPVLVSTWQNGAADTTLPSPLQFNHAVAYWAGDAAGEVWMDATDKASPFGTLPWYDQGAAMLLVEEGGRGVVRTGPRLEAAGNSVREWWDVRLDSTGSAEVRGAMDLCAVPAVELRHLLLDASARERREWFEDRIARRVAGARLDTLKIEGLQPGGDSVHMAFGFRTQLFAHVHTRGTTLRPGLYASMQLSELLRPGRRVHPVRLRYGLVSRFAMTVHLPPGWGVDSAVVHDSVSTAFGSAFWHCAAAGGGVRFEAEFGLRGETVPSGRYEEFQAFLAAVQRLDLREIPVRSGFVRLQDPAP